MEDKQASERVTFGMTREEYIQLNILRLLHQWTNWATGIGAFLIAGLSLLDYFVSPSNFRTFLLYRIVASVAIFGLFLMNRRKISTSLHHFITVAGAIIVSSMVALMIAKFGGHQSPYFVGIILTTVFVVGLAPLNIPMCIVASSIIYVIYVVPILIYDKITNVAFFINANVFILAITSGIILFRYLVHLRFISEFGLQYDLEQQKEQLRIYSTQLEDLVAQRTKELSISEKWHRSIFDNATDGIMVLDTTGKILNVNQQACEIHGFEKNALVGVNIELLEAQGDMDKFRERMSRILHGESLIFETEHYKKDGTKVILEVSSRAMDIGGETFIQSFYRDITEKKRIQEQLMHSQKMESVGSLAGGIAHNFNNILTAILGYSELLLEFSNLDDTSKQRVKNIESAARKAGVMVSKLLSFARRESHEVLPLNLNDIVNDSVKLFEGVLDKRIGLKVSLNSNIPSMEGDPNQLEQVIMNLMVNARDAMPDGGLMTIQTGAIDTSNSNVRLPADIVRGQYVVLTISDTGTGIPSNVIDRIFDPFFTTKEKGKGTGLGLATVYGIVKDHKGYITVESKVGKGTSFDIYLPAASKAMQMQAKPEIASIEGNESILLIDDDREVLNLLRDILETHGYQVTPMNNSLTALDLFKNNADKIQLVITDVVMPLMEGNELVELFRAMKPDIRIIAVSGYSDDTINRTGINAFIKKPFESVELLSTVRRILDAGARNLPLY